MAVRKNNPGCPCCDTNCTTTCFKATACTLPATGASVTVFATSSPGITLYSGTLDGTGQWCVDLTAHAGTSLSVTISYGGDFADLTQILLGNPCGRTYSYDLRPNDISGGTSGKLTINMTICGVAPTNGTLIFVYLASDLTTSIASTTFTGGVAVFTGLPTGVSLVIGGGIFETFPAFTLTCEGSATANSTDSGSCSQSWSFVNIPCGPTAQRCCPACNPNLLPLQLCLTDPCAGYTSAVQVGNVLGCIQYENRCGSCESAEITLTHADGVAINCGGPFTLTTNGWFGSYQEINSVPVSLCYPTGQYQGGSACEYLLWCDSTTVYLTLTHRVDCRQSDAYGSSKRCGANIGILNPTPGLCYHTISSTSRTCNPFSATFDIPSYTGDCFTIAIPPAASGTLTIPARTITVVEGPC